MAALFLYIAVKYYTMSLIGDKIRQFVSWLRNLIGQLPNDVKEFAGIALEITTLLKRAVDSKVVVTITTLTASIKDDAIRATVSACLEELKDWLEAVSFENAQEVLQLMPDKLKNAALIKLASSLTACMDGNSLKENQYDLAVQAVMSDSKVA